MTEGASDVAAAAAPGAAAAPAAAAATTKQALGGEDTSLAQFWYSPGTLRYLLRQCCLPGVTRVALLSAPSLYFAMSGEEREKAWLFEFDRRWSAEEHFVFFDYNLETQGLATELASSFDLVLADPPNMALQTLHKYVAVIRHLSAPGARLLFVTSSDWHGLMMGELSAFPAAFQPFMPTAVWSQSGRFRLYANYRDDAFQEVNPEAPLEDGGGDDDYADHTGYYLGMTPHEL